MFYHDLLFDLQLCSTDQQTAAREWRSQRRMNLFLRHIALASVKRAWRPSAGRRRRVIRYPRGARPQLTPQASRSRCAP
jgi:hypothetical protein